MGESKEYRIHQFILNIINYLPDLWMTWIPCEVCWSYGEPLRRVMGLLDCCYVKWKCKNKENIIRNMIISRKLRHLFHKKCICVYSKDNSVTVLSYAQAEQ